ncbi:MAG TPA: hypothetical protein VED19_00610 [Candidatus Nitrosopolaris sp.]|nr:hypothetical protein [Candidatus Nitrosopolaris sp.]
MTSFKSLSLAAVVAWNGMLAAGNSASAQTWTQTSAPTNGWGTVASSADGTKLAAVVGGKNPSPIYLSTNSGVSWTTNSVSNEVWGPIGSSTDGNILLASVADYLKTNVILISTNAGTTWISNTNVPVLGSLACSADGRKWIASAGSDGIYTSTNSGATWTSKSVPNGFWTAVASSADGSKLVAAMTTNLASYAFQIYVSRDSGITWNPTAAPSLTWVSLASSADGTKLVATAYVTAYTSAAIYTSADSGTNWMLRSASAYHWTSVASSADGNKLIAAANTQPLYVSTNAGNIWTPAISPSVAWQAVASSADGNKLVAIDASSRGGIWISQTTPTPSLNLAPTNGNVALSWIVPSTNFVLQQSPDLSTWVDMTNPPALNLTNLQDEVTLPLNNGCSFYRLKTP